MPIVLALILAPAAVLVMWFATPPIKELMISMATTWGASVGLEGLPLILVNAMPIIVPVACVSAIIAGFIFAARRSGPS